MDSYINDSTPTWIDTKHEDKTLIGYTDDCVPIYATGGY